VNISTPSPAGHPEQNISPSPFASQLPGTGESSSHHRSYKRVLFPAIGALVTGLSVTLVVVLILLIRRKSKELEKIEGINPLEAFSCCAKKGQEGKHSMSCSHGTAILLRTFGKFRCLNASKSFMRFRLRSIINL
jgi:hypothetical protein